MANQEPIRTDEASSRAARIGIYVRYLRKSLLLNELDVQ
ncbi:hypothetical protein PC116_g32301 [Phytophthora cactorum]|nr:hypothetical protein PC116_g32301 [Phytophthora cactorum]